MDGAGTALRKAAAEARIAHAEIVAQGIEQRHLRIVELDRMRLPVDLQANGLGHFSLPNADDCGLGTPNGGRWQ